MFREILPVLDNFDRALAAPPTPGTDPAFRQGMELIHRSFLAVLERLGVRPFAAVGQPFDPSRHDAVARTYLYQVARRRTALAKRFVWWVKRPLSVEAMRAAAAGLAGRRDFRLFCEKPGEQPSTVVVVEHAEVE